MTQHVKFDEFKLEVAVAIVNKTSQECGQYTLRVGHKAGCVRVFFLTAWQVHKLW